MPSKDAEAFLLALVEELREERTKQGVSQDSLATKSGVDRAIISRMERDLRRPGILVFYDLSVALGVPFQELAARAACRLAGKRSR